MFILPPQPRGKPSFPRAGQGKNKNAVQVTALHDKVRRQKCLCTLCPWSTPENDYDKRQSFNRAKQGKPLQRVWKNCIISSMRCGLGPLCRWELHLTGWGVGALNTAYFVFHRYYSTDWQEIASRKTAARRFWRDRGGAGEKSPPRPPVKGEKTLQRQGFYLIFPCSGCEIPVYLTETLAGGQGRNRGAAPRWRICYELYLCPISGKRGTLCRPSWEGSGPRWP